ncbi:uncharacterized protein SEPMUDRAFT_135879 [Sphaerulina musiva SO2202]|uniref:Uncharacterized protein n=1 Tax=Sphaerulina musiva (strain SO2202) TaxID=692275 RepID=N1QDJ1_SPHMS|nr:uncharacterized protein SEPMUDRAFT_135879 [Sphaerulina musiva SO2202]EMF09495.1 hypothetical protein SEPMUDRAFT_135879 [Sphaerulina musiva SO2202]
MGKAVVTALRSVEASGFAALVISQQRPQVLHRQRHHTTTAAMVSSIIPPKIASPNVRSTILTFSSAITPGQPCAHTDTLTSSRAPEARSMEAIRIYRRLT